MGQSYAVVPVADGVRLPFRRCHATTGATSSHRSRIACGIAEDGVTCASSVTR